MAIKKVVILVAGSGTRLLPITKSQPKEMLPVGRKPVVQYVVEEAQAAGLSEILLVTGGQKRAIEDHFDKDPELVEKLNISGQSDLAAELDYIEDSTSFYYTRQSRPIGQSDAIYAARDFVGEEHFVVAFGDTIIKSDPEGALLRRLVDAHLNSGASCTMAVEEIAPEEVHKYGVVKPKGEAVELFEIEGLVEKPVGSAAPSQLAIACRYVFGPEIFAAIEKTVPGRGGELWISDSIRILINQDLPVYCLRLTGSEKRYDIGNFEGFFRAFVDFALEDEKFGYTLRQHLTRHLQR